MDWDDPTMFNFWGNGFMPATGMPPADEQAGRVKRTHGKPRLSLFPLVALVVGARVFEAGLRKEGRKPGDWRYAVRAPGGREKYTDSLLRHAHDFANGKLMDDGAGGTGQPSLGCVVANAAVLLWDQMTPGGE